MKRILISLVCLILPALVLFGDTYKVNADVLNVRSAPDKSSAVLGVLRRGDMVEAEASSVQTWHEVEYNGTTAYVASAYLEPVASAGSKVASVWDRLSMDDLPDVGMLIRFAVTGLLLLISCLIPSKRWWAGLLSLLAASAVTLYMIYLHVTGVAVIGFEGLLGIVVEFVVLGLLTYGYVRAVLKTLLGASDKNFVSAKWGWGWIPWLIASVPVVLDHYYGWNIAWIVLMALAAYQACFCIWLLVRFLRSHRFAAALPVILVYLVSSVASVTVISSFVSLLGYQIWI